jgi:hypothetical protein
MTDGVTRLPLFPCPQCGHKMDAVGTTRGVPQAPSVADVCGCIACGCPMIFIDPFGDGQLTLRAMTADEFAALEPHARAELDRVRAFATRVYQPMKTRMNN